MIPKDLGHSSDDFMNHFSWPHAREPVIQTAIEISQSFVVQPHEIEDRGV